MDEESSRAELPLLEAAIPEMKCPCCGQETTLDLVVSVDTNTVTHCGQSIKLQPRHTELVQVLAESAPKIVRLSVIISRVWGVSEPEHADRCVYVAVSKLRPKLATIKLEIVGYEKRGYVLRRIGV